MYIYIYIGVAGGGAPREGGGRGLREARGLRGAAWPGSALIIIIIIIVIVIIFTITINITIDTSSISITSTI